MCIRDSGIEARKLIFSTCEIIKPFVPFLIDGKSWKDHKTDTIANDLRFFEFSPDDNWHGFIGYGRSQYFLDPCKLLLTTRGVSVQSWSYKDFGVPAIILAHFLREQGIVPEKSDLYTIVFLLTPATSIDKLNILVGEIRRFELHVESNSSLVDILPSIYRSDPVRFENYGVRDLCQELHSLYSSMNLIVQQRDMFTEMHFPKFELSAFSATEQLVKGNVELIPLNEASGRIAAEGVVPYPPGILCLAPGEAWGGAVLQYVLASEQLINNFPMFGPEIQGVHPKIEDDGRHRFYCYVVKK